MYNSPEKTICNDGKNILIMPYIYLIFDDFIILTQTYCFQKKIQNIVTSTNYILMGFLLHFTTGVIRYESFSTLTYNKILNISAKKEIIISFEVMTYQDKTQTIYCFQNTRPNCDHLIDQPREDHSQMITQEQCFFSIDQRPACQIVSYIICRVIRPN